MERLRLLHLNYVHLSGSYELLSRRLVWLSWKGFSLKYIPSTLIMDNLVAIDLSYSKVKQVWRGTMVLYKLKYLNLGHSYFLMKTPDFTGLTSLEELLLNDCTKLVEVHQSVGCLNNLRVLDLKNCQNLEKIPLSIFMFKSFLNFNLSGCSKLKWPAFLQKPPPESCSSLLQLSSSIKKLYMEDCNITYVPSEIGSLVSLEVLDLSRNSFSNLPATITSLPLLEELSLNACTRLEFVPALPVNLAALSANYCTSLENISMESKPADIPYMTFYGCPKLVNNNFAYNFRRNLLSYQGLRELDQLDIYLSGSEIPRWCDYRSEGEVLCFRVPQLVGRIIHGCILCAVFSINVLPQVSPSFFSISFDVSNRTKMSNRLIPTECADLPPPSFEDQMFLSYVSNRFLESNWREYHCKFDGGDEVEMEITITDGWRVKKWGVGLVYEGDEKDPDTYNYDASHHSITIAEHIPSDDENLFPPLSVTGYEYLNEIGIIKRE